jgi:hypothetical protein
MIVTQDTDSYNVRRCGKPWIARVIDWPVGGHPELEFGGWVGTPGSAGRLEIEAAPGDVLKYGQKDHRNPRGTENEFAVVEPDGSLRWINPAAARDAWLAREASNDLPTLLLPQNQELVDDIVEVLAMWSKEDLIGEVLGLYDQAHFDGWRETFAEVES